MNIHKVVVKVIILAAFWGQSVVATLNVATNGNDFTGDGSLAKPFASIQMAISSATNGSTILVQAGTYTGVSNRNLAVSGKNIDIVSESGPLNTIIDCGGVARAIVFSGAITNCLFSGFTIQNGYFNESGNWGQGGIVRVDNAAAPTIDRCIIRSNTVVNSYYTSQVGLVTINSTASVVLRNCLIIKNSVSGGVYSGGGYGTLVQSGGVQTNYIYNCTLADNTIAGNLRYSTAFFRGIVANVIDWNNSGAQSYSASNGATRYLNTLSQTIAANGIVSNNPQFFNVGVNDYTLFANSPCINSGTNMSWMTEAVDLANNARIISGFVDMGAYESGVRVSIPAQTLPAGTEMAFYSTTLQATNGMPPYLWSTTSSLPAGLLCGSNGIVSGVPTLAGTNDVDFAVQDNIGAISNRSLRIVISQNPNARPLINSNAPSGTFSMYETTNQLFQLWASDPESSNLTYTWFLDGAPVGSNASSYIYAPVWGDAGTHILRCYVSDDLWTNVVYMQWNVTVLALSLIHI